MMTRRLVALLALAVSFAAFRARPARAETPAVAEAALSSAAVAAPLEFGALRERFLSLARASYLDKTGRTPLPETDFPEPVAAAFAQEVSALRSLAAQAAFIESGRGAESLPDYADLVVRVAERLGIEPPESALAVYRDRVRPAAQSLTVRQAEGASALSSEARRRANKSRYLYLAELLGAPPPSVRAAEKTPVARRGARGKRRRAAVAPPPDPQGSSESVLDSVDWGRADELAAAAEHGAQGWYTASSRKRARREQRKRRGRCYEWVRMALQKTGLWTDEYRGEVTMRGDRRRPRRAFSFAWAMNTLETREQKDPAAARKAPLQRLDLRVDPLLIGSILVFDRDVCGFNARSGHIEVVSSIEPLRASSYKLHEVKLPCLIAAANAGRVHVYVPRRMVPPVPVPAPAPPPVTEG